MATNNKQIGLLFGVDNTGLDKGSGKTIADQLKAISDAINKDGKYTQIKFSVDTQATTDQIQKQLNQIAKGLTIKIGGFDQSTIDANAKKQADKTAEQYRKRMESLQRQLQTASNKLTTGGFGGAFDAKRLNNLNPDEYHRYLDALNKAKVAISQFEVVNGQLQFGDKTESEVRQAIEAVNNFLNVEKKVSESLNKNNKVIADLEKQANDASIKLAGMGGNADIRTYGNTGIDAVNKEFTEYIRLVKEAKNVADIKDKTPEQMQEVIDKTNAAVNQQKKLQAVFSNSTAFEKQETVYQKVIARITEYQAKFKETLKNTPQLAAQLENLHQQLSTPGAFVGTENKANQEFVKLTNQIRQAGGEAETLGQKIKRIFGEKLGYGIIASAAMMARQAVKEVYNNVVELDKAVVDLQIATGKNRKEVKELVATYSELGRELGATTSEVAKGADSWLRQGYSIEETNELVRQSIMLSKLSGLESAEATQGLTSAIKGYKLEASEASKVVDMLVAIDMEAAVTSGDLTLAMSECANSARLAGIDMQTLLGYLTVIKEVTQDDAGSVG